MKATITSAVDSKIALYNKEHLEKPLFLLISREEGDRLINEIRKSQDLPDDHIITHYKGVRIERSIAIKDGAFLLTNDLPETGA